MPGSVAPVQFEVCGIMQNWYDRGFDIDRILQKALDWHMTLLNAKSSPVPAAWRPKVDGFLKRIGYRFVLRELENTSESYPGGSLIVRSQWENKGVAPIYHPWPLGYRAAVEHRSGSCLLEEQGQSDELVAGDP